MSKLITFAVPCYNSAAYMDHCVQTLLSGGEDIEIILVDDGSTKDDTPAICDRYAAEYPDIVRAVHQENGGHGEGVNQGLRNASGLYYKVVDSDDWLDEGALQTVLDKLRQFAASENPVDLFIANYVYEHVEDNTQKVMAYRNVFPTGRVFGLMPHPEAFLYPFKAPDWQSQKLEGRLPEWGEGKVIFDNAVKFAAENLL